MTLDLYDNDLGNYNFAVIGAPGSGKSVFLNESAWSYRSIERRCWILDLGRSMEKLCRKAKGMYVEFRPDSRSTSTRSPWCRRSAWGPNGPRAASMKTSTC